MYRKASIYEPGNVNDKQLFFLVLDRVTKRVKTFVVPDYLINWIC